VRCRPSEGKNARLNITCSSLPRKGACLWQHHSHVTAAPRDVYEALAKTFARRRELGGACCAFVRGKKVVDLRVAFRTGEPASPGREHKW